MTPSITTRFLVMSDTHGERLCPVPTPEKPIDVIIHCGDLTEHSKLAEFRETLDVLRELKAPLKLVIAGNHDFSLDPEAFREKIQEAHRINGEPLEQDLIEREFGQSGEARRLLQDAKGDGITFIDEGTHHFTLQNGAALKIYASPYTQSKEPWGFTYRDTHEFNVERGTDIVVTHGPPLGIMDMSSNNTRIGSEELFAAVATNQPRMHCFGHVHRGWGAKVATWRPNISAKPTHFSDIDHDSSVVIESLTGLRGSKFESEDDRKEREEKLGVYDSLGYCSTSHSRGSANPIGAGQTLFVNAAIKKTGDINQRPWVIEIDLPTAVTENPVPQMLLEDSQTEALMSPDSGKSPTLAGKRKRESHLEANESKRRQLSE